MDDGSGTRMSDDAQSSEGDAMATAAAEEVGERGAVTQSMRRSEVDIELDVLRGRQTGSVGRSVPRGSEGSVGVGNRSELGRRYP